MLGVTVNIEVVLESYIAKVSNMLDVCMCLDIIIIWARIQDVEVGSKPI